MGVLSLIPYSLRDASVRTNSTIRLVSCFLHLIITKTTLTFELAASDIYCKRNGINKQINMELHASYVYLSMAYSMDNVEVAMPGFFKFFKKCSDEERDHAEKLMKYQNMRGGNIILQPIAKPGKDMYTEPMECLEGALTLEKQVNESLLGIHKIADTHGDYQFMDFLEGEYLQEQVQAIKE